MIDRKQAIELANNWFTANASADSPTLRNAKVEETKIVEAPFAWILPWNDSRYLAGDHRYTVTGHSPLVIVKRDGAVMWLPTLTQSERKEWGSERLHGTMAHRIKKLAHVLGEKEN